MSMRTNESYWRARAPVARALSTHKPPPMSGPLCVRFTDTVLSAGAPGMRSRAWGAGGRWCAARGAGPVPVSAARGAPARALVQPRRGGGAGAVAPGVPLWRGPEPRRAQLAPMAEPAATERRGTEPEDRPDVAVAG